MNMIEERAEMIYQGNTIEKDAYKRGAEEQREIDHNKACKWFESYLAEIGYPDDWLRDSLSIKSGKERFRKAMEE